MAIPDKKRFGEWLKDARKHADLRQEDISKCLGTQKAHVSKMEQGNLLPSLEHLDKITKLLGVPFSNPLIELGYLPKDRDAEIETYREFATRFQRLPDEFKEIAADILNALWRRYVLKEEAKSVLKSTEASRSEKMYQAVPDDYLPARIEVEDNADYFPAGTEEDTEIDEKEKRKGD